MKLIDAVMAVVGAISLIGSIVVMYVLAMIGDAVNALSSTDLSGLGIAGIGDIVGTVQLFIAMGWVWSFAVLATSLYAIYVAVLRIRRKK